MKQLLLFALLLLSNAVLAQSKIDKIINDEYEAGHFNGSLLVVKDGVVVSKVNRGYANIQFAVPITNETRIPIASMSKTFTAILTLQLLEKSLLNLDDPISRYLTDLPANYGRTTILDLLTHYSGLKNEPIQAYSDLYSTSEYMSKYVAKGEAETSSHFNYNNVDYVVMTQILEVISGKPFEKLLQENILSPLKMDNTGVIAEARIIPNLADGYHNYSFGSGQKNDTLYNDPLIYLSNYAGAGAIYSTTDDIYKLVKAIKTNKLLSSKTTSRFLTKPQKDKYIDYARGYPTIGFYYNDKTFSQPVLERRGSINGFNSLVMTNKTLDKVIIILTNTDTGDLEKIGDKIYSEVN